MAVGRPRGRILVVGDITLLYALASRLLGELDVLFQVDFAVDTDEALSYLAAYGEPELILVDVSPPLREGLELLDRLYKLDVHRRAEVVSVGSEEALPVAEDGSGTGVAHLRKPVSRQTLCGLVARLLPQAAAG